MREYHSLAGIATVPGPHRVQVAGAAGKGQQGKQQPQVIPQQVAQAPQGSRFRHHALGPAHHQRQSGPGRQRAGGPDQPLALPHPLIVVRAPGALGPGIATESEVGGVDRLGQPDRGARLFDGEIPAVTGYVPVQFVMGLEKADLAIGLVNEGIGVFPRAQVGIRATRIDAHAVAESFPVPGFGLAVPQDFAHAKAHLHIVAEAIPVAGGKIAIDTAADLLALGDHA